MKLLVGIDGSPPSARALDWAAVVARSLDAELIVAHVYSADPADTSSWSQAHAKRGQQLDRWCTPARAAGVVVEAILLDGEVGPALLAAGAQRAVDLIVVGRRGRGGFEGLLVGSAADHVAHHAERAIAVLPPAVDASSPTHLLLGLDGSDGSAAAVAWAARAGVSFGARVTAVYVPPMPELLARPTSAQRAAAERSLAQSAVALEDAGLLVEQRVVEHRHPADALIATAQDVGADAVVVGTRALGGLRRIRLGGVTMQLLHHCPQPVIAVPPAVS